MFFRSLRPNRRYCLFRGEDDVNDGDDEDDDDSDDDDNDDDDNDDCTFDDDEDVSDGKVACALATKERIGVLGALKRAGFEAKGRMGRAESKKEVEEEEEEEESEEVEEEDDGNKEEEEGDAATTPSAALENGKLMCAPS